MDPVGPAGKQRSVKWTELLLALPPYLVLLGLLWLLAGLILAFEEPNLLGLLIPALLLLSAPTAILIHLAVTSEMTRGEKRLWVTGLARNPALFASYFNVAERRAATERLAGRGPARRE